MSEVAGRRRRRRVRAHRWRAALGGVAVIGVIGGIVVAVTGGGDEPTKRAAPTTTTTTIPPDPDAGPFGIATTAVDELRVFGQPDASGEPIATLDPRTDYGHPMTLGIDPAPAPVDGWVPVTIPFHKPNDTPGWVQAADVTLTQTTYLITVDLSEHLVVLKNAGQEVVRATVILGTPETPTPAGRFYVTDPLNCNEVSIEAWPLAQCDGAYGAFALGTSGLSEALDSFAGTIPQIALHGTYLPYYDLGKDLSNGCVRMRNDVILQIGAAVPLGTPVVITD